MSHGRNFQTGISYALLYGTNFTKIKQTKYGRGRIANDKMGATKVD